MFPTLSSDVPIDMERGTTVDKPMFRGGCGVGSVVGVGTGAGVGVFSGAGVGLVKTGAGSGVDSIGGGVTSGTLGGSTSLSTGINVIRKTKTAKKKDVHDTSSSRKYFIIPTSIQIPVII